MTKLLDTVIADCQQYCNNARNILTFVSSVRFAAAIKNITEDETIKLRQLLSDRNLSSIRDYVGILIQREYAELPVRELRKIAQTKGIRGYTYMSKSTLLSELHQCEHHK